MIAITRDFDPSELAADSVSRRQFIAVIEGRGEQGSRIAADPELLGRIQGEFRRSGAVLLRDFPIANTEQAEELLGALGVSFDDKYLGGASPRSRLSQHFFTSTEAPAPYIISFHTEMCYLRQRPGKIFFYCIDPPGRYGETPIFDCAAIHAALPAELRDKIENLGMCYQRYFGSRKARLFNVYKTWREAFQAETQEQAEAACRSQGLQFEWLPDGGLLTRAFMPGHMVDPVSGRKCISLTLYNATAAPHDLRRFAHRINPLVRLALSAFIRLQYAKQHVFMRTLWGDGSTITPTETRAMIDAAWEHSSLFRWQRRDLLILDNIRCGHGRLNVIKPRRIAAALGDPYQL